MSEFPRRLPVRAARAGAVITLAGLLVACAGFNPGPRATLGAATGAAAGGLIASAASDQSGDAIAAGVLLGGLLGGALGDSLDRADRRYSARSFHDGLEYNRSGRSSHWSNPDTGHSGSVTPTRTWREDDGYCREYSQTVTIGGRTREAYGTACRDEYGDWEIVN